VLSVIVPSKTSVSSDSTTARRGTRLATEGIGNSQSRDILHGDSKSGQGAPNRTLVVLTGGRISGRSDGLTNPNSDIGELPLSILGADIVYAGQ
jgi:hypothetical protein